MPFLPQPIIRFGENPPSRHPMIATGRARIKIERQFQRREDLPRGVPIIGRAGATFVLSHRQDLSGQAE
jgi:hypothetical protein